MRFDPLPLNKMSYLCVNLFLSSLDQRDDYRNALCQQVRSFVVERNSIVQFAEFVLGSGDEFRFALRHSKRLNYHEKGKTTRILAKIMRFD